MLQERQLPENMSCPNAALAVLKGTAQHQQISGFRDKPKIQVVFFPFLPSFPPSLPFLFLICEVSQLKMFVFLILESYYMGRTNTSKFHPQVALLQILV